MTTPTPVNAVVDHDARTVTVAFTFRWTPEWAMDKCEVIPFVGGIRDAIAAHLTAQGDDNKATGFSYTCFEPNEEVQVGYLADYTRATCTLCGQPAVTTDAAPWFEHVGQTDCRNFLDDIGDEHGYAIRFANLLDVDLTKENA